MARGARYLGASASLILLSVPAPALTQSMERATPVLDLPNDYPSQSLKVAGGRLSISTDARLEYDDNVFAEPGGRKDDDVKLLLVPRIMWRLDGSDHSVTASAVAQVRRFAKLKSENSLGGTLALGADWSISSTDRVSALGRIQRVVEDRGDPEARSDRARGPRLINVYSTELSYARQASRIGMRLQGSATRLDHVSAIDAVRDHSRFAGVARINVELSGTSQTFAEAFVNYRDFRLRTDDSFVNRDALTYGGRGGVAIDPGGAFSGEAAIGLFRLNPADARLDGRTGLSLAGNLIFRPSPRTAFTLEAFSGDVATVRSGATARIDTRVQLGVQQEVRHNLRAQGGLLYRRSKYIGSGIKERTWGGLGELEYLMNRRVAVAAVVRYGDRASDIIGDRFKRLRAGIELRLQY